MDNLLEKLKSFLDSDEGKDYAKQFAEKKKREQKILESQMERFNVNYRQRFQELMYKLQSWYDSDRYVKRCYSVGMEPPNSLYFFLLKCAEKFGREGNEQEYNDYGNSFTAVLYYLDGYYFNLMIGQGSAIIVTKSGENEPIQKRTDVVPGYNVKLEL